MQYWQRKLQRSVTETRRSEIRRPWPSISGSVSRPKRTADGDRRRPAPCAWSSRTMEIRAPDPRQPRLEALLDAANADERLHGLVAHAAGERRPARHVRPLLGPRPDRAQHRAAAVPAARRARGVEPAMVADHGHGPARRRGRDRRRLPVPRHRHVDPPHRPRGVSASSWPPTGCRCCSSGIYDEPERTIVVAEALHAIIGHRRRGDPITIEAGIVRVADALDMAQGRSRVPFESRPAEHPLAVGGGDRRRSRSSRARRRRCGSRSR